MCVNDNKYLIAKGYKFVRIQRSEGGVPWPLWYCPNHEKYFYYYERCPRCEPIKGIVENVIVGIIGTLIAGSYFGISFYMLLRYS